MNQEGIVRIAAGLNTGCRPIFEIGQTEHTRTRHTSRSTAVGIIMFAVCGVLGACRNAETAMLSQAKLGGQVEFTLRGGFAGLRQRLAIDDNGWISAQDEKRGKTVRAHLDPARLASIRAAFMNIDAEAAAVKSLRDTRCRDCFHYTIQATIDGKRYRNGASSTTLSDSPYGDLIKSLSQILRETLSQPTNIRK